MAGEETPLTIGVVFSLVDVVVTLSLRVEASPGGEILFWIALVFETW